ncbi:MAG: exodeoxyribonuclease VII small subunit [Candidatus Omnitrophota bacterium]|nr:MAG: exodeoxyribonuclease VII small subunit [Candidatus Omnitrophota bacterium]
MKFDQALQKLEEIVKELESPDVPLEKALSLFEEGIKLVKFCTKKLSEVERKIEVIMKDEQTQELTTEEISEEELLKEENYGENSQ